LNSSKDWQELTQVTQGKRIVVGRARMVDMDIAIAGSFELPQLDRLPVDDQIFITAFVRSYSSIKEMERIFGVSYPTIKSRPTGIRQRSRIRRNQPRSFEARDP
jgi:hypothetical protein